MNNLKPFFAIGISILFVMLGFHLINKSQEPNINNATLTLIAGVACIVFFGGLLILALFKSVRK